MPNLFVAVEDNPSWFRNKEFHIEDFTDEVFLVFAVDFPALHEMEGDCTVRTYSSPEFGRSNFASVPAFYGEEELCVWAPRKRRKSHYRNSLMIVPTFIPDIESKSSRYIECKRTGRKEVFYQKRGWKMFVSLGGKPEPFTETTVM